MSANTIICPTILFINEIDWKDTDKKESLLADLQFTLQYVMDNNSHVLWNDNLEQLLWQSRDLYPWCDYNYYAIYNLFEKVKCSDEDSMLFNACNCIPDIVCNIGTPDIISPTLSLFHYLISLSQTAEFLVDKENEYDFEFFCECHEKSLKLPGRCIRYTSPNVADTISQKWSEIKGNSNILDELIELMRVEYFSNKSLVYNPVYESSFLRTLENASEDKEKIVYKLTYRLTLKPAEVAKIRSFNDESIKNHGNLRSFRIDGVCRIYYEYEDGNKMVFKEYTGQSEHDVGTRHT